MYKLLILFTSLLILKGDDLNSISDLECSPNYTVQITYKQGLENELGEVNFLKDVEYILNANNNYSKFELLNPTVIGSANMRYAVRIGGSSPWLYDFKQKRLFNHTFFKKEYWVEIFNQGKWEITDSKMIVAGKKCRKANYIDTRFHPTLKKELTQVTEVWFLEEIKIPCGPLNYNGLPGAIVRIRIPGLGVIQAESIKITENKFKAKQFPKLRNIISDNELRKKFNKK